MKSTDFRIGTKHIFFLFDRQSYGFQFKELTNIQIVCRPNEYYH